MVEEQTPSLVLGLPPTGWAMASVVSSMVLLSSYKPKASKNDS